MHQAADQLRTLAPALAFLLTGVPLAALLDRLGFFDAVAVAIARHRADISVGVLWALAAATTVVLNLDTTIVLLTPLYVRIARRGRTDPLPLAVVPLLLACLASSVLPVSNLTTLIVVDRYDLGVSDVLTYLALPSLTACAVGWLAYRRRHPTTVPAGAPGPLDRRALRIGTAVTAGLLVGFVLGPSVGLHPWAVALVADVVLCVITRTVPWRDVPVVTAFAIAAVGVAVALAVPGGAFRDLMHADSPAALVGVVGLATIAANAVNNLPALLAAIDGVHRVGWGTWAWLLGVNTGAVLLPIGAIANLLWRRILREERLAVPIGTYVRVTVPVALPALAAAAAVLALERLVAG